MKTKLNTIIDKLALFVMVLDSVIGVAAMVILANAGYTKAAYVIGLTTVTYEIVYVIVDMVFDMKIAKVIMRGSRP